MSRMYFVVILPLEIQTTANADIAALNTWPVYRRPPSLKGRADVCTQTINTLHAYHFHGNFGGKFPSNSTGIFLAPKTGTGLSCTIYKIPVKFSLSL